MLYYVSGTVTVLEPGLAVVDCGGVGYGCRVTAYTAAQLKLNQPAKLFITEAIREDAYDIYGFSSREDHLPILLLYIHLSHLDLIFPQQFDCRQNILTPEFQSIAAALFLHPPGCPHKTCTVSLFVQQFFCPLGKSNRTECDKV